MSRKVYQIIHQFKGLCLLYHLQYGFYKIDIIKLVLFENMFPQPPTVQNGSFQELNITLYLLSDKDVKKKL